MYYCKQHNSILNYNKTITTTNTTKINTAPLA